MFAPRYILLRFKKTSMLTNFIMQSHEPRIWNIFKLGKFLACAHPQADGGRFVDGESADFTNGTKLIFLIRTGKKLGPEAFL